MAKAKENMRPSEGNKKFQAWIIEYVEEISKLFDSASAHGVSHESGLRPSQRRKEGNCDLYEKHFRHLHKAHI